MPAPLLDAAHRQVECAFGGHQQSGVGDAVLLAEAGGSIKEQVRLVEFLWRAAPLLTLAHDVGEGGLELALAEAGTWSGRQATAEGTAPYGSVVLACPSANVEKLDWPNVCLLGAVA